MICHTKQIEVGWLEDLDEDLWDYMIKDAFKMLLLQVEKVQAQPKREQEIDEELNEIMNQEELNEDQSELEMANLCVKENDDYEHTIYKKGGTFGGIEKRPGLIEETTIYQLKKPKQKEFKKGFGDPTMMLLQTKQDSSPEIPWDPKQASQYRIVFYFQQRTPIWIYFQNEEIAKKWWNYLRTQQLNKDNTEIYDNFQIYRQIYCIQIFENFQRVIHNEALEIVEQKKKAAKLSDNEIKILGRLQKNIISFSVEKWKEKNHQVMLDLQTNAQEEKKKQQQIEEAKKSKKLEENKQKLQISILKENHAPLIASLAKTWQDLAEQAKFFNEMKQKAFVISFKSINVAQSIQLVKPVLTVSLENKNPDFVPELAGLKKLQQGQKKQDLFYFRLQMLGKLKSKRRENYLNWELIEQSFDNLAGQNKLRENSARPYCSMRISNMNLDDYLCFSFEDSLAIFHQTQSELFKVQLSDLVNNMTQGRSIWLPLVLVSKEKDSELKKDSIILIEMDLLTLPSKLVENASEYHNELDFIVRNNRPIIDPIYQYFIKIPEYNLDLLKVLFAVIQENNPYMKDSLGMINYITYISEPEEQKEVFHIQIFQHYQTITQLKYLTYRKIIENVCHLMGQLPDQLQGWEKIQEKMKEDLQFLGQTQQLQSDNLGTFNKFLNQKEDKFIELVKQFVIGGIPCFMRDSLWFSMLQGKQLYADMKEFLKKKYCVLPEHRFLNKEDVSSLIPFEYQWVYYQLNQETSSLQQPIVKEIVNFLKNEDKLQLIPSNEFSYQLERILKTYMLVLINHFKLQPNFSYFHHLFLIASRLLSLSKYHYIHFSPKIPIVPDLKAEKLIDLAQNSPKIDQINEIQLESLAFWLLLSFHKTMIMEYPYFQGLNKKILFQDASHLNVYLINALPEVWNFTRIYEVKVETTLCEAFLNLFSDIFSSESLFRMWDLIIVDGIIDSSERPLTIPSILGALIKRLSSKLNYIYSFQDFISAVQLEGIFIEFYFNV